MGGRGSGSGGGSLGGGYGKNIDIVNVTDVWTYRHRQSNEPFVDAINTGVGRIESEFPGVMDTVQTVQAAELGGLDSIQVLGFYGQGQLALNQRFTDIGKMNSVYDKAVQQGFHPSRGDRTGTEAVALHEMGHALTDHIGKKMGAKSIDEAAQRIVSAAYKASGEKAGIKAWAKKISGYATESDAECIAEAVADWYCNGSKSTKQSQAIMAELRKYR